MPAASDLVCSRVIPLLLAHHTCKVPCIQRILGWQQPHWTLVVDSPSVGPIPCFCRAPELGRRAHYTLDLPTLASKDQVDEDCWQDCSVHAPQAQNSSPSTAFSAMPSQSCLAAHHGLHIKLSRTSSVVGVPRRPQLAYGRLACLFSLRRSRFVMYDRWASE